MAGKAETVTPVTKLSSTPLLCGNKKQDYTCDLVAGTTGLAQACFDVRVLYCIG